MWGINYGMNKENGSGVGARMGENCNASWETTLQALGRDAAEPGWVGYMERWRLDKMTGTL